MQKGVATKLQTGTFDLRRNRRESPVLTRYSASARSGREHQLVLDKTACDCQKCRAEQVELLRQCSRACSRAAPKVRFVDACADSHPAVDSCVYDYSTGIDLHGLSLNPAWYSSAVQVVVLSMDSTIVLEYHVVAEFYP